MGAKGDGRTARPVLYTYVDNGDAHSQNGLYSWRHQMAPIGEPLSFFYIYGIWGRLCRNRVIPRSPKTLATQGKNSIPFSLRR
jgi:hypothetical protein